MFRPFQVVTITHNGYVKRTLLNNFTAQKRGGKGKIGAANKNEVISSTLSAISVFLSSPYLVLISTISCLITLISLDLELSIEGLRIAVQNIDEVVKIIKESKDTQSAKKALMDRFDLF